MPSIYKNKNKSAMQTTRFCQRTTTNFCYFIINPIIVFYNLIFSAII